MARSETHSGERPDRQARLEAVQERLAAAVEQLVSGEDWRRALVFAARFRSRSFGNTLLIGAQHAAAFANGLVSVPEPSYVAGYRQWQSLGRQVSQGQPGYQILAPVTGRFATVTPQEASSWRRLGRSERPRPGEVVRSRMVGVRPAYVWDVSQTTGEPISEQPMPRLLEGQAPAGLWEGLTALVEADGFRLLRVGHEDLPGGANGLTNFASRTVAVASTMDAAAQAKTLAHELAHVRLHGPEDPEAVRHRGIGEVEAESVALMIGAAHGMDTRSYTIPYVSGWAATVDGKDPAEVVRATGERVRWAAGAILDALETVQVGSGDPPSLAHDTPQAEPTPAPQPIPSPVVPQVVRRDPAAPAL